MNSVIDELIDRNLTIICESGDSQFFIPGFEDSNGDKISLINPAKKFASQMEGKGLITVHGEFASVEEFGWEVYKSGGWKKFLTDRMENDIKEELYKNQKESLDFEKLKTDLALAKQMLKEYPKTKWFARIAFMIATLLVLKDLVFWILSLLHKC